MHGQKDEDVELMISGIVEKNALGVWQGRIVLTDASGREQSNASGYVYDSEEKAKAALDTMMFQFLDDIKDTVDVEIVRGPNVNTTVH